MPDTRDNLQVRQPGIEGYGTADKQGWPDPLVNPSNPLKIKVTNSSNGSTKDFKAMSTDGQDKLTLTEGRGYAKTGDMSDQGGHGNKWQTSQQNAGDHSETEGEQGA
jgi:hypothetical protein